MSNADAHLDLRLPIGGLFTTLGGVLGGFGLLTGGDASRYVKSGGINLNLWWGAALLVMGLLFLIAARRSASGARRG
ncbi:MAG: hypothetical protein ACKOCV_06045 [Gemmatimonadota bacterium]